MLAVYQTIMGNILGSESKRKRSVMVSAWDQHCAAEFDDKSVDKTMATMVDSGHGAYVLNVPVCKGGFEIAAIRSFYAKDFIPANPTDVSTTLVSRTVDTVAMQIVDEIIFSFTHDIEIQWMLDGIPPTNAHVRIPLVVVIGFSEDGKRVKSERIYWDQAGVLEQIGALNASSNLPITGKKQTDTLLDPSRLTT